MLNAMDCPLYSRAHSSPPKVFTESNVTSNRRRPDIKKKQYVVLIVVPAFVRPHIRVISLIRSYWFLYVSKRSFALAPNISFKNFGQNFRNDGCFHSIICFGTTSQSHCAMSGSVVHLAIYGQNKCWCSKRKTGHHHIENNIRQLTCLNDLISLLDVSCKNTTGKCLKSLEFIMWQRVCQKKYSKPWAHSHSHSSRWENST